jgi:hypothetical protein
MFRSVIGFAILAMLAWFGIKIMFAMFTGFIALAATVMYLAAVGFCIYLVLRVVSPTTADKIREIIRGSAGA